MGSRSKREFLQGDVPNRLPLPKQIGWYPNRSRALVVLCRIVSRSKREYFVKGRCAESVTVSQPYRYQTKSAGTQIVSRVFTVRVPNKFPFETGISSMWCTELGTVYKLYRYRYLTRLASTRIGSRALVVHVLNRLPFPNRTKFNIGPWLSV